MAQFEEVLDDDWLAMTLASPAEVPVLLEGLGDDQIISEAYSKSSPVNLHRLTEAPEPVHGKPRSEGLNVALHFQGSTTHWRLNQGQLGQVRRCGSESDHMLVGSESVLSMYGHNGVRSEVNSLYEHQRQNSKLIQEFMEGTVMDKHFLSQRFCPAPVAHDYYRRLNDKMTEVLRFAESKQKPGSDNERGNQGNLGDEEEWLEQVEEATSRTAVPLWQCWDARPRLSCTNGSRSESMRTNSVPQSSFLDMEEKTGHAAACRTPDVCNSVFRCTEPENTSVMPDPEGATDTPKGCQFSTYHNVETAGLNMDYFQIFGATRDASPVEACVATDANNNLTDQHVGGCWTAAETTDTTDDLFSLTEDAQCKTNSVLTESYFTRLLSSCTPKNTQTVERDNSLHSTTGQSMTEGGTDTLESVLRTVFGATTCSTDGVTDISDNVDSHWDAKMQEVDLDPFISSDFGDLPEDLSEYMTDDILTTLDPTVLLGDPWLNDVEELISSSKNPLCDITIATEVSGPDNHQQSEKDELTTTKTRRKRQKVPQSQWCTSVTTRAKRQRRTGDQSTGQPNTTEAQVEPAVVQGTETRSGSSPAETLRDLSTSPTPRILHFYPSQSSPPVPIHFITIPDSAGYQVVQLSAPPPVIRLPLRNTAAAPTYIFVPATPPPNKHQVAPLSPVDGAVAPIQMSSSPPGSLSDSASKAMSPPRASPPSSPKEMSPCKEPPPPQSPPVPDIPQVVKDYIQEAKAHMSQTCQHMEAGLNMTSHYVDVQVSKREILVSGKNTNKCLDKELIIMGDTDRQKSLVGQSQIFEGFEGKSKRYILLFGNAGTGKTTLIKKLCLDWSRDNIPQFDFVFLLDGKRLTVTQPVYGLKTLLLNLSTFAPSCTDPEVVYAQILAAPKRVLIILDGFDELRDYESLLQTQEKDVIASLQKDSKSQTFTMRQLYSALLQRVLLPGCTLLLSTRPRGTAIQLLRRADSFLEVCGFSPVNIETYLSQYFSDPALRTSALDALKSSSYLHFLCRNPGVCRLVCLVLEQVRSLEVLPRTLTGLCHQVLCLKMKKDSKSTPSQVEDQTQTSVQPLKETQTQMSNSLQENSCHKYNQTRSSTQARPSSYTQRGRRVKRVHKADEEMRTLGEDAENTDDRELLSQLSSLAWEGVKANSSSLPTGRAVSAQLKAFGLRTGLFLSHPLRTKSCVSSGEKKGGGGEDNNEMGGGEKEDRKENAEKAETEITESFSDHMLLWANPFLQSYMAAVHLSLSRSVSDRSFLQNLPFQSAAKVRRRPQREELELTQRFAVGLLFHNQTELQRLHSYTEKAFRDMVVSKQAVVTKHLEGLSYGDLSPAQVLEACHYVYEATFTNVESDRDTRLVTHLAANLPEVLTFRGVPLGPPDVFAVQNAVGWGETEGRRFCLDLEDSGIQICGLRTLVGLPNINTYRACIADVITLWEQLDHSGEEELLKRAVSKFKIHPLKATQVCHIEHLEKLVKIHMHKRLSDSSSSQSDSILTEGVPAVNELHKLEFDLGPEKGPLSLPKLWELLPGLHNLQHLDLEKSKMGDEGAEKLADALLSLRSLEILNLSQNCIGDQGVKKLTATLKDLPKLHCLSLYSNVISDEGAESLAAVLPHMASLTDLDVSYNKLTDVGAQSLGASLRNCKKIKTLRMWNQCIPYIIFERLRQLDNRILLH